MTPLQKSRLRRLADFLETRVAPERFNLDYYVHFQPEHQLDPKTWQCHKHHVDEVMQVVQRPDDDACKSTCCALGWCPTAFPADWYWAHNITPQLRKEVSQQIVDEELPDGLTPFFPTDLWGTKLSAELYFGLSFHMTMYLFYTGVRNLAEQVKLMRAVVDGTFTDKNLRKSK